MIAQAKIDDPQESFNWLKLLTATVSVLASILTIYVTMSRTVTEAKYADLSLKPNLKSFMVADSAQKHSGIKVKSSGSGALVIKKTKIYKRGDPVPLDNNSYAVRRAFGIKPHAFSFDLLHAKDVLEQGSERWLIQSINNSPEASRITQKVANNISMVVCYCSTNDVCEVKTIGIQVQHSMQC